MNCRIDCDPLSTVYRGRIDQSKEKFSAPRVNFAASLWVSVRSSVLARKFRGRLLRGKQAGTGRTAMQMASPPTAKMPAGSGQSDGRRVALGKEPPSTAMTVRHFPSAGIEYRAEKADKGTDGTWCQGRDSRRSKRHGGSGRNPGGGWIRRLGGGWTLGGEQNPTAPFHLSLRPADFPGGQARHHAAGRDRRTAGAWELYPSHLAKWGEQQTFGFEPRWRAAGRKRIGCRRERQKA